jgi:hypothetical protein
VVVVTSTLTVVVVAVVVVGTGRISVWVCVWVRYMVCVDTEATVDGEDPSMLTTE